MIQSAKMFAAVASAMVSPIASAASQPSVCADKATISSTSPSMTDAERLRWLTDRAEIGDLLLSFAASVDAHDASQYAANFVEDGVLELPFGKFESRKAIEQMPPVSPKNSSHHVLTNFVISMDGDRACARAYVTATHVFDRANPRDNEHAGGWYDYDMRRTAAGWKFAKVKLTVVWESGKMLR